tara:strand:- start:1449 stop:1811 length:363 start_codon:yes stop_codon:yes gene_type:complete
MKKFIKDLVRESLAGLISEKNKTPKKAKKAKKAEKEEKPKEDEDEEKVDYSDVQNFFDKHKSITKVGVFREAGFSEEDIYTRIVYKKLDKEKNDEGVEYTFNRDEVARIRAVTDKYPSGG